MFSRILVALDGSARDADVLAVAGQLARRTGASMLLVRIESRLAPAREVLQVDAAVGRQAAELQAKGLEARHVVECGQPARNITAIAKQEQSDLIVLVSHYRDDLQVLWQPGVVARMLVRASAPLLIWPEDVPGRAFMDDSLPAAPVLVPLDGSPLGERALPLAVAFATVYQRPLLLVRVVRPFVLSRAQESAARRYLDAAAERIGKDASVPVETALAVGEPADQIVWRAEGRSASLVVMSAHGRSGVTPALSGSVTAEIVRRMLIPLVVVPLRAPSRRASP
jgi:nucleotide-binding universal stress UspA family protein